MNFLGTCTHGHDSRVDVYPLQCIVIAAVILIYLYFAVLQHFPVFQLFDCFHLVYLYQCTRMVEKRRKRKMMNKLNRLSGATLFALSLGGGVIRFSPTEQLISAAHCSCIYIPLPPCQII